MNRRIVVFTLLVYTVYAISNCANVPSTYNISVPYDYGMHKNYSYEYWEYQFLLKSNNSNGTFGVLFAITRCSATCLNWDNSAFQVAVSISTSNNTLVKNIEYWEQPDFYIWHSLNPFHLNMGFNSISAQHKNNWDRLKLQMFVQNVYVNLNLQSINPDRGFINNLGKFGMGIHVPQSYINANGIIVHNDTIYLVSGFGNNDHYISNVTCRDVNNVSWKWFAITLSNRNFILVTMIYGKLGVFEKHLMVIYPNGTSFDTHAFYIYTMKYWTSPHSGIKYPIKNRIIWKNVLDLIVTPNNDDNELFFLQKPIVYKSVSSVNGTFMNENVIGMSTTEIK